MFQISPGSLTASATSNEVGYGPQNLINGNTNDLYTSDWRAGDIKNPTVTITSSQIIDKIVVYNRVDSWAQEKIVGANIKVYKVSDLINVIIIIIIILLL